ncbi:hypothetical protein GGR56DRAFT_77036 [Xylariaceae sp. FL0804]|nr:hypothetical protein GGR56DRAFT_77036 [Xylariaceae sp. FL0804]
MLYHDVRGRRRRLMLGRAGRSGEVAYRLRIIALLPPILLLLLRRKHEMLPCSAHSTAYRKVWGSTCCPSWLSTEITPPFHVPRLHACMHAVTLRATLLALSLGTCIRAVGTEYIYLLPHPGDSRAIRNKFQVTSPHLFAQIAECAPGRQAALGDDASVYLGGARLSALDGASNIAPHTTPLAAS